MITMPMAERLNLRERLQSGIAQFFRHPISYQRQMFETLVDFWFRDPEAWIEVDQLLEATARRIDLARATEGRRAGKKGPTPQNPQEVLRKLRMKVREMSAAIGLPMELVVSGNLVKLEIQDEGPKIPATPLVPPPVRRARVLLPKVHTRFVDREKEMEELLHRVVQERMVTLLGAPGIGKSRLALEVASAAAEKGMFSGGVYWMDIGELTEEEKVEEAVLRRLNLPRNGNALTTLAEALRGKGAVLLVLDNGEMAWKAVREFLERMLQKTDEVHFLVTSRERFDLTDLGEFVYPVGPLPELGDEGPAVELFLDRAYRVGARIPANPEIKKEIREICDTLDRLPLAIEIVSRLTAEVPLHQLRFWVEREMEASKTMAGLRDARHASLETAVSWSLTRLPQTTQVLFARISLFRGSIDPQMVKKIFLYPPITDTEDGLRRLARRSLIEAVSEHGFGRYRILEPVRRVAELSFQNFTEEEKRVAEERFVRSYMEEAENRVPLLFRPNGSSTIRWLDLEQRNLLQALDVGMKFPVYALRLLRNLMPYWRLRGLSALILRYADLLEPLLERHHTQRLAELQLLRATAHLDTGDLGRAEEILRSLMEDKAVQQWPSLIGEAYHLLGKLYFARGDLLMTLDAYQRALTHWQRVDDVRKLAEIRQNTATALLRAQRLSEAERILRENLSIWRREGDVYTEIYTRQALGLLYYHQNDYARAARELSEALQMAEEHGATELMASAEYNLAVVFNALGMYPLAERSLERAWELYRGSGAMEDLGRCALLLGDLKMRRGDTDGADRYYREALNYFAVLRNPLNLALSLGGLATVHAARGEHRRAARLLGAADAILGDRPVRLPPSAQEARKELTETLRRALGLQGFQRELAQGRELLGHLLPELGVPEEVAARVLPGLRDEESAD